jgi:hypothetical protein
VLVISPLQVRGFASFLATLNVTDTGVANEMSRNSLMPGLFELGAKSQHG